MRIALFLFVISAAVVCVQPVFAAKQTVAVLPSDGEGVLNDDQLTFLTNKTREKALEVLPKNSFEVFPHEVIIKRLGGADEYMKKCKESSCIVDLGREAQVDYVARCRFGKLDSNFTITFELYKVSTGALVDNFTEPAKNFNGLLAIIEKRIPEGFKKIKRFDPEPPEPEDPDPPKYYIANIKTDPAGAGLSFNGIPNPQCLKTPCSVVYPEGDVQIVAKLDQYYETADTTVFIKQNNQDVRIELKKNFGVLEIKYAYEGGIGMNEDWKLTINNKANSSWKNKMLLPGKYNLKLSHTCYKDISHDFDITKGGHEVFQLKDHANLKKAGLVLIAEKDGSPVSEPVFVNGQRVGETPYSGSVAVCSEIEIGVAKENVNVKLEHKQIIRYVHKVRTYGTFTDKRDGKEYKTVEIGTQTWMAENLNYNANGKCYDNKPENCKKYGRLYNWQTALEVCPSGWHLPSEEEWKILNEAVGGEGMAGKKLKTKNGWNSYQKKSGNGTDEFGFSALPGGYGKSDGSFDNVGYDGYWWNTNSYNSSNAYNWLMNYNDDITYKPYYSKSYLLSVRCLQSEPLPQVEIEKKDFDISINHGYRTFTDKRDGKEYKTIEIGTQTWMAENLNYNANSSLCYKNEPENCEKYGRLYDWVAAMKACPSGWHLPSISEYEKLDNAVGGENVAGKKLKAKSGWNKNGNGTDEFGFSALPGGYGYSDGSFYNVGNNGDWWSTTEYNASYAYLRGMIFDYSDSIYYDNKSNLRSVRCVQGPPTYEPPVYEQPVYELRTTQQ